MTKSQQLFLKILGVFGIASAIGLAGLFVWKAPEWQTSHIKNQISTLKNTDEKDRITLEKDRITLENATRSTLIQAFGGLFLITTAYFSWRNLKATEEKQVTERFSKAVEQLGNADIHVRLGGIYALERIAKDSDKDYWQIMEILTAYVREKAPVLKVEESEKVITRVSTDIQAVLTVLTRRAKAYGQGEENPLDLSKSNLQGANLQKANLQKADLYEANLQGANLQGANLQEANLQEANLWGAQLSNANLREADLWKANLQETLLWKASLQKANLQKANLQEAQLSNADLQKADLQKANLQKANLQGALLQKANLWGAQLSNADLREADLREADLREADLQEAKNLTPEQVQAAKNWKEAHYEKEFLALLGLPPSVPESKN